MSMGDDGQRWDPAPVNGGWPTMLPPPPPPAGPRPHRGRPPLVLGLVVAVLLAAGGVTGAVLIWKARNQPIALTVGGVPIDHPDTVLARGQDILLRALQGRTEVHDADTRCYFVRTPTTVHAHNVATDVDLLLDCGPVLFTDSDSDSPMISIQLSSQLAGSRVLLTPANLPIDISTLPLPPLAHLLRPDGKSLPANLLSLAPPRPPAAPTDLFRASGVIKPVLGTAVSGLPTAMAGYEGGLVLNSVTEIQRFGSGEGTLTAATGHKLLAFTVQGSASPYTGFAIGPGPTWGVSIDGAAMRTPSQSLGFDVGVSYVVDVPRTARTADLVLVSQGVTQTLSLFTGKPGSANIAVLTRRNLYTTSTTEADVPVVYAGYGQSAQVVVHVRSRGAFLGYWGHGLASSAHPLNPDHAYLEVPIVYTDPTAKDPTELFAFPSEMLTLTPTGGAPIKATDLAPGIPTLSGKIFSVFEVPSTFTSGTVTVSGTVHFDADTTATVSTPFTVEVDIPAG